MTVKQQAKQISTETWDAISNQVRQILDNNPIICEIYRENGMHWDDRAAGHTNDLIDACIEIVWRRLNAWVAEQQAAGVDMPSQFKIEEVIYTDLDIHS